MTRPPDSMMDKAVAAAMWGAGLSWLVCTLPVLTLVYRMVPSHRVDWLTRIYIRGQVRLTLCRWQAHVDPAVEPGRPYIFVQNHVNLFDHVTMYEATPHFKQGIELASHFRIPFYGWFMKARGTIPVDRDRRSDLLLVQRRMKAEIELGNSVLAFPEGTRTRDGRVQPFHSGIFHIARQLGVPVVPVAVTGMFEVLATPGWVMRPLRRVDVHVMAPIPTTGLARKDVDGLARLAHDRVAEKVDAFYASEVR